MASLFGGFAGAELDSGAALALAQAGGCPRRVAARLVAAFAAGLREGAAERERQREAGDDTHARG